MKKHANVKNVGDKVEKIAKPVAKIIDRILDTDLTHCQACEEIKKLLNDENYLEAFRRRIGMKNK